MPSQFPLFDRPDSMPWVEYWSSEEDRALTVYMAAGWSEEDALKKLPRRSKGYRPRSLEGLQRQDITLESQLGPKFGNHDKIAKHLMEHWQMYGAAHEHKFPEWRGGDDADKRATYFGWLTETALLVLGTVFELSKTSPEEFYKISLNYVAPPHQRGWRVFVHEEEQIRELGRLEEAALRTRATWDEGRQIRRLRRLEGAVLRNRPTWIEDKDELVAAHKPRLSFWSSLIALGGLSAYSWFWR